MSVSNPALPLDVERAVRERYSAASQAVEPALCCAVQFDARYLEVLPEEIRQRDYGCGDPVRHVAPGEVVVDLGSGGGKICYIAAQIVGATGLVIGVDRNDDMLELARKHQQAIGERLGYHNTRFHKGSIQDLALDLELFEEHLREQPILLSNDWLRAEAHADQLRRMQPMIADEVAEVVVSNCVLNLVRESDRRQLFAEVFRVLKVGGRAVISDIVCDRPVPPALKNDPQLWSGCLSGAFVESDLLAAFLAAGFSSAEVIERQREPWQVVAGIEFRSATIRAHKSPMAAKHAGPALPVASTPCCSPKDAAC